MGKVKIGVFGAARGMVMIDLLMGYPDAQLVAICDKYTPLLDKCRKKAEEHGLKLELFENFEDFFQCDMDAVVLANYAIEHAPYAIRLLESGRHVLSECLPVQTMGEAVALTEAVEKSGKIYHYAENVCFFRHAFEMFRRYRRGDVGEIVYGEGEYVHCRQPGEEGLIEAAILTYGDPNHWRNQMYSTYYCTHSLGPILYITGLRPVRVIGMEMPPTEETLSVGNRKGVASVTLLELENGAVVKNLVGGLRKLPCRWNFQLYGSKGCMETDRWENDMLNVYTDYEVNGKQGRVYYECPPIIDSELAKKTTAHGGADFYATHYFIQTILGDSEAAKYGINIYQALDMALPGILGYRSILGGSIPIEVPNFRIKEVREAYRYDNASTIPKVAGANLLPVNKRGNPQIPAEVYEKVRKVWLAEEEKRIAKEAEEEAKKDEK